MKAQAIYKNGKLESYSSCTDKVVEPKRELSEENQQWFDSKISNALVVFAPCDVKQNYLKCKTN